MLLPCLRRSRIDLESCLHIGRNPKYLDPMVRWYHGRMMLVMNPLIMQRMHQSQVVACAGRETDLDEN